jgi:DNA-binding response OmpR family regulator
MAAAKTLAVEDDQNLLATLKYNLIKEGYGVITAADGAQAIEIAHRERPELIVLADR